MKKRTGLVTSLIPLVIAISLYVVFNSRIECEPNHVGFWFVFVLGMSVGVALTGLLTGLKKTKE